MEVAYSFVCDAANVSESGNLNAFSIFDTITTEKFPVKQPRITYVAVLKCHPPEAGQHSFTVSITYSGGKRIAPDIKRSFQVNPRSHNVRLIINFNGITFNAPGTYCVDLAVDAQLIKSVPFTVVQVESKHSPSMLQN
jgi:hypothetical protein